MMKNSNREYYWLMGNYGIIILLDRGKKYFNIEQILNLLR